MKLILVSIFAILFFVNLSCSIDQRKFGPWFPATEGEPWPVPWKRIMGNNSLILRPLSFKIETTNTDCSILQDAIERYKSIIFEEAKSAAHLLHGMEKHNSSFSGIMTGMLIQKLNSCESQPYFQMDESYSLEITDISDVAILRANTVWGALRGLETFTQLLSPSGIGASLKLTSQQINDKPRMPHRGLLLDTSRHFIPVDDIFLILDALSYNKLNVFHWHIVDDNSFPYESNVFPKLSLKGSYHPTMVYSAYNIRKVIEYARIRGIRVIPEFDTPAHTTSWGQGHPELLTQCYDKNGNLDGSTGPMDPTKPVLYTFLRSLLEEVVRLFPDKYLHVGGDEVPFECWESNPDILTFMRDHNITKNFTALENIFINRLLNITYDLNIKPIVWQEVFDNGVKIHPGTVVQVWTGTWQSEVSSVTNAGFPVILSTCWYLDHVAGGGDWRKYYLCDPLSFTGSIDQKKLMMGGEACMWAEFVDRNNVHSRIWPRASAAAERLWSFEVQSLDYVSRRLEEHACRMNKRGIPAQPPNGAGLCIV
ncbi:beta-hexosaminidase subunit beta-like isoform X4 [Leptopilina heterotoma]|uniref:beta-hexosaminidase subunit beta-like isoform X4 n=1 Tax=Leptopilina heterotoma TaxID=63436 RepID=UPI001CA8E221|nr:beta-hexosaminidase subunit beta-like isoform X4 [Leptopilina heterotoma]